MGFACKITLFIGLTFFAVSASSEGGVRPRAKATPRQAKGTSGPCKSVHLKLKNCRFNLATFEVQVTEKKILVNDGVWRWIQDLPLRGEKTQWEKSTLRQRGQGVLLELWIWDEPSGEAQIQALRWFVIDLKDRQARTLLDQVVQRRRPNLERSKPESPVYIKDPLQSHGLNLDGAKARWFLKDKGGPLE